MSTTHPLRIFAISTIITITIAIVVGLSAGLAALWLFFVLALLEVTFSFDNAVINSKILGRMSPLWQKLFLTVGIFIAVFVVRFALPLLIVMAATQLSIGSVIDLALNHPVEYGEELHKAGPIINAFGGTFLLMIAIGYFFDKNKVEHWLHPVERLFAHVGKLRFVKLIIMAIVTVCIYFTVDADIRTAVLISSIAGILLQFGLESVGILFDKTSRKRGLKQQVGWAAFASFMYLEVLDASFSFDGVIGAFALTTSVLLIVAGLGVGAFWVRSMTVYLLRTGALAKYRYLEHGAHWAILALGIVMLAKLFHVELPEWLVGSLGVVFIALSVGTSVWEKRLGHLRRPRT